MEARHQSVCSECGIVIRPGDEITRGHKGRYQHDGCRRQNLLRQAREHLAAHSPSETETWLLNGYAHADERAETMEHAEAIAADYSEVLKWVRA
jgi:hypothetical protein